MIEALLLIFVLCIMALMLNDNRRISKGDIPLDQSIFSELAISKIEENTVKQRAKNA